MRGNGSGKPTRRLAATYFNSRLYMRGNASPFVPSSGNSVHFNSRLYMRGNVNEIDPTAEFTRFQFTPLHERQPLLPAKLLSMFLFQFTPLHERQLRPISPAVVATIFQFTPLHERQQQKCTIFSIKSTQFSTKPCFFIVTSRKVVFFSIPVQYFL